MCGTSMPQTVRAISVEDEVTGKLMGVAGIRHCDPRMVFADIDQDLKKHPRTIVRLIRWVTKMINHHYQGVPLYAIADVNEPTAPGLLAHMGFEHILSTNQGEVFQWHPQQ